MKLVTNKDFTKEYTNDAWRGFSLSQVISLLCALGVMILSMCILNKWTGIPLATCVYVSVPVAVPVLALGFYTYQDMNILTLLLEIWYSKKTASLAYEAEEYPGGKIFSLQSRKRPGISAKEWKQRKKLYRQRRKRGRNKWDY